MGKLVVFLVLIAYASRERESSVIAVAEVGELGTDDSCVDRLWILSVQRRAIGLPSSCDARCACDASTNKMWKKCSSPYSLARSFGSTLQISCLRFTAAALRLSQCRSSPSRLYCPQTQSLPWKHFSSHHSAVSPTHHLQIHHL